jgi:hypothetical protein
MFNVIKKFLAAVPKASKGILLPEELFRTILTAMGSSSVMGLLLLALHAVLINVAVIFPTPIVASLATAILTIVVDQVRRLEHGATPAPIPTPTPTPSPIVPNPAV